MRGRLATLLLLAGLSGGAGALGSEAAGTFVAVDDGGQPTEKIFRVSRTPGGWKFEDRQPDGSWLDVSCHGGCAHRESRPEDLIAFFGSPPPPNIRPECVQNQEYAFCHFAPATPGSARDGYVLVVRINEDWLPVSLVRLPGGPGDEDPERPQPKLESARRET